MKVHWSFRVPGDPLDVGGRTLDSLLRRGGWSPGGSDPEGTSLRRGTRGRRLWSFRIENWPSTVRVRCEAAGRGAVSVDLSYDIATGLHFVGAVEQAVIEAEVALLRDDLLGRPVEPLAEVVRRVRRPVGVAVVLNVCFALVAVTFIALFAGLPWPWGPLLAIGVALVDAITIAAFADLLAEGFRRMPRLTVDRPVSICGTGSMPGAAEREDLGSLPAPGSAAADHPDR